MDKYWQMSNDCHSMRRSFIRKQEGEFVLMEKHMLVLTKRSLNASIVTTLVTLLWNVQQRGHMMERRRRNSVSTFYQHQEAGKQEKNQMGLLTMDDGIVNWGEHTEDEETNHALMAISSSSEVSLCSKTCIDSYNTLKTLCDEQMNQLGDQEAQILAYSQAVKKLEAQLVTFQK
ncbi:hypothetical protein Tco_0757532 [Tanacetum coccineum]